MALPVSGFSCIEKGSHPMTRLLTAILIALVVVPITGTPELAVATLARSRR